MSQVRGWKYSGKKADDKIMFAKLSKTFSSNCILLKIKGLEAKHIVDPDEMAHYEPSHLDPQCLQKQLLLCLALQGLIKRYKFPVNNAYSNQQKL